MPLTLKHRTERSAAALVKRLIVDFRYHAANLDDAASVESVIKLAGVLSESAKKLSAFLDEREVKNVSPEIASGVARRTYGDLLKLNSMLGKIINSEDCVCPQCGNLLHT